MNEPTRGALRYLALSGALFLSACDFSAGVYRNYRLEEMPAPQCVEETLAQVPGVHDVTHSVIATSTNSGSRRKAPTWNWR